MILEANRQYTANQQKLNKLRGLLDDINVESCYETFEEIGVIKNDYVKFSSTHPVNVDKELERLSDANIEITSAIATMLLREDHWSNGSFRNRVAKGDVNKVIQRLMELLND